METTVCVDRPRRRHAAQPNVTNQPPVFLREFWERHGSAVCLEVLVLPSLEPKNAGGRLHGDGQPRFLHVYICMYVYVDVCVCVSVCLCVCIYLHICNMCVCVCYVCVSLSLYKQEDGDETSDC